MSKGWTSLIYKHKTNGSKERYRQKKKYFLQIHVIIERFFRNKDKILFYFLTKLLYGLISYFINISVKVVEYKV